MRGDRIIARAFGGKPFVGRVWNATVEAVHICTDEDYRTLTEGNDAVLIGAPRKDVFEHDPALLADILKLWQTDLTVWERAELWLGDVEEKRKGVT